MGFSCLFGHKWTGLQCERCGRTRKAFDVLAESPLYKCDVCGTTGKHLREAWEEKSRQLEQLGGGVNLFGGGTVMLFCKECNSFVCSKCALDGDEFKRCPHCQGDFDLDSLAEYSSDPLAMLALAAQKASG